MVVWEVMFVFWVDEECGFIKVVQVFDVDVLWVLQWFNGIVFIDIVWIGGCDWDVFEFVCVEFNVNVLYVIGMQVGDDYIFFYGLWFFDLIVEFVEFFILQICIILEVL